MFPESKIIFSPSGLRFYSLYCHKVGKFVSCEELYENSNETMIDYNYDKNICLFKYLKRDRDVEIIANEQADVILTNSTITQKLFKKIYQKFNSKLYPPISLSNICNKGVPVKNKKYDIVFLCYNWKRGVKNGILVNNIITDSRLDKYKILLRISPFLQELISSHNLFQLYLYS